MPRSNSGVGSMGSASGTEVGPTEDTVMALLEFFLEPLLPRRSASAAPGQDASMAKQVQAVVLLYNYYHRRHNPELEYLDSISFCKLVVIFKPSLLTYMKVMQRTDHTELADLEKELSLMERTVMEACDVSKGLEMSEDIVAGWPVFKVAIFLVDHGQENVFLLQSSDSLGVWSVIEKDNSLGPLQDGSTEQNRGTKKKRITKKPLKQNKSFDENGLQQLAFSAVNDACGYSKSDLKVLESHTVHSLSKEKTSARFYIIQCTLLKEEHNYVPIRDVIKSLQGPLVRKGAGSWSTTSVVEYFPLLPYTHIILNWFSRKEPLVASLKVGLEEKNREAKPTDAPHEDHDKEKSQNEIFVLSGSEARSKMLDVEKHCSRGTISNAPEQTDAEVVSENQNMEAVLNTLQKKHEEISVSCLQNDIEVDKPVPGNACPVPAKAENRHGGGHIAYEMNRIRSPVEKVVEGIQSIDEQNGVHITIEGKPVSSSQYRVQDHALIPFGSAPKGFNKIHEVMSARGSLLLETALKVLHRKREMLCLQLLTVQDEIALCDRNIQTILSGGEDDLAVALDAIIDACNDMNTRNGISADERIYQHVQDQNLSGRVNRKRSYETV